MAATETLPSTTEVPITTASLLLPGSAGPIAKIMESVPTQSVAVDTRNSAIQVVLLSEEIEMEVIAPNKKTIKDAVGLLVGGEGFQYELEKSRRLEGLYDLKIISLMGVVEVMRVVKRFQAVNRRVTVYFEGNLVAAL
jgi:hypothetical protein